MLSMFLTVCRFVALEEVGVLNLNRCGFWGVSGVAGVVQQWCEV